MEKTSKKKIENRQKCRKPRKTVKNVGNHLKNRKNFEKSAKMLKNLEKTINNVENLEKQ